MNGRPPSFYLLLGLTMFSLTLIGLSGCDAPGKPDPADRPLRPSEITSFEILFSQNCAGCHGANGTLGPAPPLNDPLFRAGISMEELTAVISDGRAGTLMPGFGSSDVEGITPAQINLLAHAIKGIPYQVLSQTGPGGITEFTIEESSDGQVASWGLPGRAPADMPPLVDPPAEDSANALRGQAVFATACAACHGNLGQGRQTPDGAIGAINDPTFLALISDRALRRLAITGRADLGMPNYAGKAGRGADFQPLTSQQIADLVALLASWRNPLPSAQP